MEFGTVLHGLRTEAGVGLKRLAPRLGVSYTYLSKLEANRTQPSEELVVRVAAYFGYDQDALLLSANKIPLDIREILRNHPDEAVSYLRARFGSPNGQRPES